MKDSDRKAFEAWFSQRNSCDEWVYNPFSRMEFNDIDAYSCSTVNTAWLAWQAAKAQVIPEGFAVVPIEITPKQIEAYMKGKVFPASMSEHRKFVERLSKDYKAMIEVAQESTND